MEIKKILNIESPVHLYRIMERENEIVDGSEGDVYLSMSYFMDCVYEYLYGCKCDEEANYERMVNEYTTTMRGDAIVERIKEAVGCDGVVYN
jgi:hypothetical protein